MGNLAKEKVELSIKNLKEKSSRLYFFVQDSKGNAKASIRYIYQMAMALKVNGFNPIMLHEKNDYFGVGKWLGQEYTEIPHKSIEGQNLEISPEDFLIIPEIFGYICMKGTMTKSVFSSSPRAHLRTEKPSFVIGHAFAKISKL